MTNKHTALVVGASGGIGLALTRQLLNQPGNRNVYATYRQSDAAGGLLSIDDERLHTLRVVSVGKAADSGRFVNWDGRQIPW